MEEGNVEYFEEEVDGEGLRPGEFLIARLVGHIDDVRERKIMENYSRKNR
jgi:hypothetical protein